MEYALQCTVIGNMKRNIVDVQGEQAWLEANPKHQMKNVERARDIGRVHIGDYSPTELDVAISRRPTGNYSAGFIRCMVNYDVG
jgi:hypothetical protein